MPRAAFCAARQSSKRPKQVAPDPDMRARRQPRAAAMHRENVADDGRDHRSRVLQVVARPRSRGEQRLAFGAGRRGRADAARSRDPRPAESPSAWNTATVSTGTPGLTSTAKTGGSAQEGPRSSPRPRIMRARAARQTGTSAPVSAARGMQVGIVRRDAVQAREQPQGGRGVRGAAAEAGGDGQALGEVEAALPQPRPPAREGGGGAQHEVVSAGPAAAGAWAGDVEATALAGQRVSSVSAAPAKATRLVQRVPAVRPAAEHVQGQVDLGGRASRRGDRARRRHDVVRRALTGPAAVRLLLDLGRGGLGLVRQAAWRSCRGSSAGPPARASGRGRGSTGTSPPACARRASRRRRDGR